MFRTATIFRFDPALRDSLESYMYQDGGAVERRPSLLWQGAQENRLKPVGPLEFVSQGFVSPYGREHDQLIIDVGGHALALTIGREQKILPAAAVNEALAKRLAELERREGRAPGGRARKRIREELVEAMLPHALVKPGRIDALIDMRRGLAFVDCPARRRAEGVVSEIRLAMGSFPALPLNAEVAPRSVLTGWLSGNPLPEGLALGDAAILRDPADSGARVRLDGQDLQGDEVLRHLEAGKQATRLALWWNDLVGFTLDEDLVIRNLRYTDLVFDGLENIERDTLQQEIDARLLLQADILGRLFDVLEPALRFSKVGAA